MATTALPREPAAYRPSNHFAQRFHDRYDEFNRHLDGEIVATCIREGEVTHHQPDKAHLEADIGGVRYRLVVAPDEGAVITGHPVALDEDRARESGRWSSDQRADIRVFLAAKENHSGSNR